MDLREEIKKVQFVSHEEEFEEVTQGLYQLVSYVLDCYAQHCYEKVKKIILNQYKKMGSRYLTGEVGFTFSSGIDCNFRQKLNVPHVQTFKNTYIHTECSLIAQKCRLLGRETKNKEVIELECPIVYEKISKYWDWKGQPEKLQLNQDVFCEIDSWPENKCVMRITLAVEQQVSKFHLFTGNEYRFFVNDNLKMVTDRIRELAKKEDITLIPSVELCINKKERERAESYVRHETMWKDMSDHVRLDGEMGHIMDFGVVYNINI